MEKLKFYIDGAWVDPAAPSTLGIVNPATEETFAQISLGSRPMWIAPPRRRGALSRPIP